MQTGLVHPPVTLYCNFKNGVLPHYYYLELGVKALAEGGFI